MGRQVVIYGRVVVFGEWDHRLRVTRAQGVREESKKFGRFCHTLYLCTPFAQTGKTVEFERRVGQSVKTPPFHGGMRGSTPLRGTQALWHKKLKAIL